VFFCSSFLPLIHWGAEGGKVRQVGPIVYGYSMTVGPDGVPRVKEFGNVKSPMGRGFFGPSMLSAERKPFSDIATTDEEVKVAIELPGVSKENIKINAYDGTVEVISTDPIENIMKYWRFHQKQILKQPNPVMIMGFSR
jgi:HSP20 family molecular chaperone IbpA